MPVQNENSKNNNMNNKTIYAFIACVLLSVAVMANDFKTMKLLAPVKVRCALLTDAIDTKGKPHDTALLMMNTHTPLTADVAGATIVESDSAGCFRLPAALGNNIYVLTTSLRADRFAKATLRFTSPARIEVYVDGAKVKDKMKAQDSLKRAEVCELPLRMEPQATYNIAVKMLVAEADSCEAVLKATITTDGDTITKIACSPELKGRYLLPQTIYGNQVQSVSVSPDGRYLLTTYLEYNNARSSNSYTVLSEVKSGKKITTYPAGSKVPSWTPRTSQLYYKAVSDVGEKIILVNPATLEERVVADHVPGGAFRWAPDEKTLYFHIAEQLEADKGPVHRLLSRGDRVPNSRNRNFIWRYDLSTGVRERLTAGSRGTNLCDISDDSKYLLYSSNEADDDQWPFGKSSLYRMNVQTLEVDTLFTDEYFFGGVARFSPDATKVLLTGGPESFGGIGKNCGSHPIGNNYDTQAYILTLADKSIEPITKDFAPTVQSVVWNRYDGCIYLKTNDRDRIPVYCYNPVDKSFRKLPLNGDCVQAFSLSRNAGTAAYTSVTASSAQAAYLYDVRKSKSTLIANPYAKNLEKMEMGTVYDWSFTASDGTEIDAFYSLPPAFDAAKKYPLIVYYYGGTTPTAQAMGNPYAAQLFSSRGYVTLVINPSGTIGYGQEFSARHVNAWGQRTADDIIEGTKAFCKEFPYVDAEHIGCLGASYGGFMTQYLQTRTDIFAAAASHAGISNITSYWGEGYWGVGYNAVAAAQSYPWNNPDLFTKQGSLFNADKINTPLLLLHGTADTNVPIGESIQLYNALRILGKTVEFVRVDGEDHFIADVPKRILWHNTIMAWFERWLKNDARWWNDIYPERVIK